MATTDDRRPISRVVAVVGADPVRLDALREGVSAADVAVVVVAARGSWPDDGSVLQIRPGDEAPLGRERVSVLPPGVAAVVTDGRLQAMRGDAACADDTLTALATSFGERLMAVLFVPPDGDGATGAGRVGERFGVVVAAAEPGVDPDDWLALGVDQVLPVELVVDAVATWANGSRPTPSAPTDLQHLPAVLTRLALATGHDFSSYKKSTVLRRVTRRLEHHHLESLERTSPSWESSQPRSTTCSTTS